MPFLYKSEVARRFFPEVSGKTASRYLRRCFETNDALRRELEEAGFDKGSQRLSPREYEIIVKYLGEP